MNLCIIPARGGSKRIPKKNIKEFCGKPLIAYSIEVAIKSKLFDKIVISTDDETIAKVASVYKDIEVQLRPKELSDDYVGTGAVFEYVLEQNPGFKYACMIYATAPFLQEKYLKEGLEKLKNSTACASFSATSFSFPIQRAFKLKDSRCEMFDKSNFSKRSQDLQEAYHDAGQFYWKKTGCKSDDVFFGKDSIPIILPRYLVQDIDTMEDFTRAEYMYKAIFPNRFDKWNELKQKLHAKKQPLRFHPREIFFVSVGENIGQEVYGKDELFLRPVLVYKKLSKTTFLGTPLTSTKREGKNYFSFEYKKGKTSIAQLNQIRVFDSKRLRYYSGKMKISDYKKLEVKLNELFTLSKKRGSGHSQKGLANTPL